MLTERKSSIEDILFLSDRLRKEDIKELSLSGFTPIQALRQSYYMSEYCYTLCLNNIPVALFGAGRRNFSNSVKRASIWFLGTKHIEKCKTEFLKKSKKYIEFFKTKFDILENYTDAENSKNIKWLKWLGFQFDKPVEVNGGKLVYFSIS